jgi:hypothetical protein
MSGYKRYWMSTGRRRKIIDKLREQNNELEQELRSDPTTRISGTGVS